jgi:hypothetical protein
MACINGYEVPPVCFNGSGAGFPTCAGWTEVVAAEHGTTDIYNGPELRNGKEPVINGEEERGEFKAITIGGTLASSTYENETACAMKELLKNKVLGVLLVVGDLKEVVDVAVKEDPAIFGPLKKDLDGLTTSFIKLQFTWAKVELERTRGRLRGAEEAAQPLTEKCSAGVPVGHHSDPPRPPKGHPGNGKARPRMSFGPVTTPNGGPGYGCFASMCNRFHATPRLNCTAGIPKGHHSGKEGWCAFTH